MGYAARNRAQQRAAQPAPRLIFGLTRMQKITSFKLSYALAMVHALKKKEAQGISGTTGALYVKLDNLEEHILRVLEEYRIADFHKSDLDKASALFAVLDDKIHELYP